MAHQATPQWWGEREMSTWDRVKEALSRDWEQTKADFSNEYGKDLNQSVGHTVKQAVGAEPLPAQGEKTPSSHVHDAQPQLGRVEAGSWNDAEPAIRYGYGASSHYETHAQWDDKIEGKLREEWNDLKSGRTWDEVKTQVRYGWERARRAVGGKDN